MSNNIYKQRCSLESWHVFYSLQTKTMLWRRHHHRCLAIYGCLFVLQGGTSRLIQIHISHVLNMRTMTVNWINYLFSFIFYLFILVFIWWVCVWTLYFCVWNELIYFWCTIFYSLSCIFQILSKYYLYRLLCCFIKWYHLSKARDMLWNFTFIIFDFFPCCYNV